MRAGNNHEKEYLVTVNKTITDAFVEDLAKGVPLLKSHMMQAVVITYSFDLPIHLDPAYKPTHDYLDNITRGF